jgi:phosphatidylglycerophosphate synthase
MSAEKNVWQEIQHRTGGIVTPANVMDFAAINGVRKHAPELDTALGIAKVGFDWTEDLLNGPASRMTGTTGKLGEILDHVGDKIKLLITMWNLHELEILPRNVELITIGQQAASSAITAYDNLFHHPARTSVNVDGEHNMMGLATGISLHTIGAEFGRNGHPTAEQRLRITGSILTWGSALTVGRKSTLTLLSQARGHGPEPTKVSGRAGIGRMASDLAKVVATGSAVVYGGRALSSALRLPYGMEPELQMHETMASGEVDT